MKTPAHCFHLQLCPLSVLSFSALCALASLRTLSGRRCLTCIADMNTIVDAVGSGDPGVVETMVGLLGGFEAAKQLSALRTNDNNQLETFVMLAAIGGDTSMFHAVLRSLRRTLAEWQVLYSRERQARWSL